MNEKTAKLKKRVKHYMPEIIVGASVIAGAIAVVKLRNQTREILIALSPDEWAAVVNGGYCKLRSDIGTIYIAKEYHN